MPMINVSSSYREGQRVLLAAAMLFLGACATPAPRTDIVFPPPPDVGRIQFIRAFGSQKDMGQGFFARLFEVLIPRSRTAQLANPFGIAISPDDRWLYVTSTALGKVVAIELETGNFRTMEATDGVGTARPLGVAVDAAGQVYVCDRASSSIVLFDASRKFKKRFTDKRLYRPSAIAIDRKAQILYVVNDPQRKEGAHSIEVFSLGGEHVRTIGGGAGAAEGSFYMPAGVAVSPAGELYVADKLNFRVQVFDREGRFLRSFGQQGIGGPGFFDKVNGIAFDSFGNVYIVDALQGVQILNDEMQPLMAFNNGLMQLPLYIAISSTNRIYVTDFTSHTVNEFQLINTRAGDNRRGASSEAAPQQPAPAPSPAAPERQK